MTETLANPAEHDTPPAADAAFARWLGAQAGDLLLELRCRLGHADPDALRAAGDAQSHALIVKALARWRPGDAVLSEESYDTSVPGTLALRPEAGTDDRARLDAERVWIVDPLDGTREFGEEGRADWAVHIGLWQCAAIEGGRRPARLTAGAIALPAHHRVLATDVVPPYPPLSVAAAAGGPLRLAASRSRPPAFVTALAQRLGAELVPMGSAGAKIAAVIDGAVDAYVHAGGQYEWDSAAPVAVALATGLHASRLDGSGLEYNRPNPRLPDLVVCRKDLASRLLATLDGLIG
jgi:3'(2'), 5'-bisphosphate nucleotidase